MSLTPKLVRFLDACITNKASVIQEWQQSDSKIIDINYLLAIACKHGAKDVVDILLMQEGIEINKKVSTENFRYTFDVNKQLLIYEMGNTDNQKETTTYQVNANDPVSSEKKELPYPKFPINNLAEGNSTALINAVQFHIKTEEQEATQLYIVKKLLSREDIDVNAGTIYGTPLHQAVAKQGYREPKLIKLLLNHPHIDVNIKNKYNSIFECACYHGVESVIKLLLEKNPQDNVTLEQLRKDGYRESADLLETLLLVNSNAPTPAGQNKLFLAAPNQCITTRTLEELSVRYPGQYIMIVQRVNDEHFPIAYRYDGNSAESEKLVGSGRANIEETIYPKPGEPMVEVEQQHIPLGELNFLKRGGAGSKPMTAVAETPTYAGESSTPS